MAAELVGGALLSASLHVLFEKMASPEVVKYLTGKKSSGLDGLFRKLKIKLSSVTAVLDDAEYKQIRNQGVKDWLDELQNAVCDAEDLLAEIEADALQLKMEADSRTGLGKVSNFFSSVFDSTDRARKGKIEEILERLEYIASQKDILGLKELVVSKSSSWRLPSTSLVEESGVYGRDDDKDVIIKLLLSNDEGSSTIGVIPIVGMGGIGKTTLAQLVYNDDEVKKHFELTAWVCVSEEFDVCRVTKIVLQSVSSTSSNEVMDLNSLQVQLKERLKEHKFLIVLDDVWNENYVDWDVMTMPFKDGAQGSKIIVTTRSKKVASIVGTVSSDQLKELSSDASWELFAKHASGIEDFTTHPELERIGREIVRKCRGLPLALKTLGGLLRSTLEVGEWEKISKSEIWDLTEEQSKILPALRLSYNYLPSPLKRCFAYCSIFPKDHGIEKEELIQLWMAESLLERPERSNKMEEVGDEYFNDLVSRCFFQPKFCSSNECSKFIMHDLVVDLASSVSRKYSFPSDKSNFNEIAMMKKTRRLMVDSSWEYLSYLTNSTREVTCFRSVIVGGRRPLKFEGARFLELRCLRVFSLPVGLHVEVELPDSIGELRLLRYLNLSHTGIKRLPESLAKLCNLQTLKLKCCLRLTKLPEDFHRLINLRYLDVFKSGLLDMPTEMGKLKSLRKLSIFLVGKDDGKKLGELGELSDLTGQLEIKNLQNVSKAGDALEAKLRDKNLEELILAWDYRYVTDDTEHERAVLDNLLPNTTLKKLEIHNYEGTKFPNWLGNHSLICNIVHIVLFKCTNCYSLPPLGQLSSLKSLAIMSFSEVVRVGPEFYGNSSSREKPFASLESLTFHMMQNWVEWLIPDEAFMKLKTLALYRCEKLTNDLPCFLPNLTRSTIHECPQLSSSLPMMPIIRKVSLELCEKITGYHVVESFECLEDLGICKSLDSTTCRSLPANLKRLTFSYCNNLKFPLLCPYDCPSLIELHINQCHNLTTSAMSWNLPGLHNLTTFEIRGSTFENNNIESFPEDGLLPRTIKRLEITSLEWLRTLDSNGLQRLTSLTSLSITDCFNLQIITGEGLPPSLEKFEIQRCPLLAKKCEREKGEYWSKISHILSILTI